MTYARSFTGLAIALLAWAGPSEAGPCDAYFPFDGNLQDRSGNGYHGLPIAAEGEPGAPQFADGKIGQALRVTGGNAMRAFIDLHYDFCPQVTVTAWFRLESVDASGNQYIFSTGGGGGPGIRASGGAVAMNGTGNGISQPNAIRDKNTWFFVAGVYDTAAGTYRLHWRNRIVEGEFSDNRRPPEDSFWVGTFNDSMSYTAQDLYVDDLRIHGRALTADDLTALAADTSGASGQTVAAGNPSAGAGAAAAAAGARLTVEGLANTTQIPPGFDPTLVNTCTSHDDCTGTSYCAWDRTCHPESHAPMQELELAVVQANPGVVLPTIAPEPASAGEEPEYEQMPAPNINAVMDLKRIRIDLQTENRGDEYYLVTYPLRGRRGTGVRVATFEYADRVFPLAASENWAKTNVQRSIQQNAGRQSFENLEPFEVYGFVAVLMEKNKNTVEELTSGLGYGEFQNEAGVLRVVHSAFDRAIPRETEQPDYSDTSCGNVTRIFFENMDGLAREFGGLGREIANALAEPLKRNNRDLLDGSFWHFYMNVPGGDQCISYPTVGNVYSTPGSELSFKTYSTTISGEHLQ